MGLCKRQLEDIWDKQRKVGKYAKNARNEVIRQCGIPREIKHNKVKGGYLHMQSIKQELKCTH